MISGKEIKVLDKNAEFNGIPTINLMENAGKGIADFIINKLKPKGKNIIIFCGTGNNGGDGFVAARYLSKKYKVTIFITGTEKDIRTDISKLNFQKLKKIDIKIYNKNSMSKIEELLSKNNIIIDSMLGIGLSGDLREPYNPHTTKFISKKIVHKKYDLIYKSLAITVLRLFALALSTASLISCSTFALRASAKSPAAQT